MSSGKKKVAKKRTYTEGEYVRAVRMAVDEATKKLMLMYITAVAEKYDATEEDLVELLNSMQRYVDYEQMGLVPLQKYSKVLENHGVDLKLRRW